MSFPCGAEVNRAYGDFLEQANFHHPTIKLMAEISVTEIVFLDTVVYKGTKFQGSINSRCKNTFWTCGDLSIYALHLLSPAKREKSGIRKRWSPANPSEQTRQRTLPWKTFQNLKEICRTEVILSNNTQYLYFSRPMFHHWNFLFKDHS